MLKARFLILLTLLSFGCRTNKQSKIDLTDRHKMVFMDYFSHKYPKDKPGASILVIKKGEVVFNGQFGLADVENKIPVTDSTNFRIASITKQFTAAAILKIIEQDKLTYETTLKEIFPNFPDYGRTITIQNLLTHRSGLVRYQRFLEKGTNKQLFDDEILKGLMQEDSTYFPPGLQYQYSNTGYAVLSEIVAKISGMSFTEFMDKSFFQPLEMNTSTVYEPNKMIKNRAFGYVVRDTSITKKDQSRTSAIRGDGGIYMSVSDYQKWDKSLYSNQILSKESLENAFSAWNGSGKTDEDGYGFGWQVSTQHGLKYLQHGGSSSGFGSHVIRVPELELMAVIFTNRNKTGNNLQRYCKALLSVFSDGQIPMPIELPMELEIEKQHHFNEDKTIQEYNILKQDFDNYENNRNSIYLLAFQYFNEKQYNISKTLFELSAKDFPHFYGGFYGLGLTHQQLDNNNLAIKNYKKAISNLPKGYEGIKRYCEKQIDILSE